MVGRSFRNAGEFSSNEVSRAILDHVQEMKVSVAAQLDSTTLTFEEIMNLQVNDMLLLDKTVDEPIDLIVDGQKLYTGRPAKSAGRYAVTISGMAVGDTA